MKLEVGMYVRTSTGIHKIFEIDEKKAVWKYKCDKKSTGEWDSSYEYKLLKEEQFIGEPSFDIIDLIEKNDLVVDNYGNIYMVDYVFDNYVYTTTKQGNITKTLCDYQIKSIVTKEMFESMEYKIGG